MRSSRVLTGLVLDNQLEIIDVVTVDIASGACEREVSGQARVRLNHVRGRIAWTGIRVGLARLECADACSLVRKWDCSSEARGGGERKQELVEHGDLLSS